MPDASEGRRREQRRRAAEEREIVADYERNAAVWGSGYAWQNRQASKSPAHRGIPRRRGLRALLRKGKRR